MVGRKEGQKIAYNNHVASCSYGGYVGTYILRDERDADLAIQCALLHDVLEDTEVTYKTSGRLLSVNKVAQGVLALS